MKTRNRLLICAIGMLLLTGCGKTTGKGMKTGNSVDDVINSQIKASEQEPETVAGNESDEQADTEEPEKEMWKTEITISSSESTVDYDLTQMDSDMVYATVYQMMAVPEQYEGKTFRIEGNFYEIYFEPTAKYYFYCVIQDATACCAQGMEFVWGDGSHVYPDEYPEEDAEVIVEGTFETYTEEGDENLYCRLKDATLIF